MREAKHEEGGSKRIVTAHTHPACLVSNEVFAQIFHHSSCNQLWRAETQRVEGPLTLMSSPMPSSAPHTHMVRLAPVSRRFLSEFSQSLEGAEGRRDHLTLLEVFVLEHELKHGNIRRQQMPSKQILKPQPSSRECRFEEVEVIAFEGPPHLFAGQLIFGCSGQGFLKERQQPVEVFAFNLHRKQQIIHCR